MLPKSVITYYPLDLMWFEKANSPPLPLVLLPDLMHLLLERQRLSPDLLESVEDKLPDFVARDPKDFAEGGVALPGDVPSIADKLPVLELDDVIDMFVGELFHLVDLLIIEGR